MNLAGSFICLEGGDGAGKSTLARKLTERLLRANNPAILIDKSTEKVEDRHLAERLETLRRAAWEYPRDAALAEWGDFHWFHLLVSWFSLQDFARIRPLLARGKIVVADSWMYKYQARFYLKPAFSPETIQACCAHLSVPDKVLLLDVDPEVAVKRRLCMAPVESGQLDGHGRGTTMDFVRYQNRVRSRLLEMAAEKGWTVLDGGESEEVLLESALEAVAHSRSENQNQGSLLP